MLRSWLTRRTSTTLDNFRVLYLSLKRVEHCQAGFERALRPGLEYECVCLRRYSVASADAWHQWHALVHYLSTSWCSPKRSCTPTKYLETRSTSSSWARILLLKLRLVEVNLLCIGSFTAFFVQQPTNATTTTTSHPQTSSTDTFQQLG